MASERVVAQATHAVSRAQLSQEQQERVGLNKEPKQAELDRIAQATRSIKKGGRPPSSQVDEAG